jgi:transketolase
MNDVDQIAINTIRFLAVDMVEKADSGHPGAPMGQAAMAYVLWARHQRHSPVDPTWLNRDRFVLSCGHASALLYSILHLSGYKLSIDDLKSFRQLGSKTPGHPELEPEVGIETTTGPLGQGLSTAVGMAMAERMSAARFNRDDYPVIDYNTWVFASDGDLMEGVASEASSLAGHLGLGKLIVAYDDNRISIDGPTSLAFSEDVEKRYESYGWHVLRVEDGNDVEALDGAYAAAKEETNRPSLISVRTHIGFGSTNKQDSAAAHGSPLGSEEVEATRKALGWPSEPTFLVPDEAKAAFRTGSERGEQERQKWLSMMDRFAGKFPDVNAELERRAAGRLPDDWLSKLPEFTPDDGPLATRKASGRVLNAIGDDIPELVGGSADLAGSNNTSLDGVGSFSTADRSGRNLHFGVREHAMGSILNGLALSRMLIPYGGTFLIFSDYMRPAIRLAALMGLPVKYVFTHDSIFLGEDGPTHQPISQLLSLRSIPGLTLIRPADASETAAAWKVALERQTGPTALALTRQSIPILAETSAKAMEGVSRGGYVVSDASSGDPEMILIATGSEVALAYRAHQTLTADGIPTRVVSMPSWELFDEQNPAYRDEVLPPSIRKRIAIEAGAPLGWERYVGDQGSILGIEGFGASAPQAQLAERYGFTVAEVVRRAHLLLESASQPAP